MRFGNKTSGDTDLTPNYGTDDPGNHLVFLDLTFLFCEMGITLICLTSFTQSLRMSNKMIQVETHWKKLQENFNQILYYH